ncbi:hypothetical protein EAE32_11485 [Kocuria tytonicola]|uniref:DUF4760 domain-containing protein n=1 Tax=Kocuria tytonicola TaxID=2055946 RepID=A0A3L9L3M8_9MICC|nr:hypothetical protein [Kocuria tytonicola]RLY91192.1 hypothetical protein EAE32_11485 [Kocuria tytonicola]
MLPDQFFDVGAWIDNFWIPLMLAGVLGAWGVGWRFCATRRSERHRADAEARKVVAREFSKASTQLDALRMYDFQSGLPADADLARKQDECLEIIARTTYGPAAKIARNAGNATLSPLGVNATSLTAGNLKHFASAYKHAQVAYLQGETPLTPGSRWDLVRWARTYRFAAKVLDPHRITPVLGFLRLGFRSMSRVEDILRFDGHTLSKKSFLQRLKWILTG